MKVVVAGEIPFLSDVGKLCVAAGHDTTLYLVEDFLDALHSGFEMTAIADAEVVIELHHETTATKQELLRALGHAIPAQALLLISALNVSTTQAASWLPFPERVVGFGVLPPFAAGDMVELAVALQTEAGQVERAASFWEGLGVETAVVADGPGLVRGRTICCIINEATSALMEGVANAADIDQAMQLGTSYPRGPLAWADEIGVDTVLGVMNGLFSEWGEDRYRPSPLLRRMVAAGRLGRKSGTGFYTYDS